MAVDWGGGAVYLLAPAIATDLGLSAAQVGLLFTAMLLGPGLVALPAGIFGDTFRFRGLFLLSTFWWVAVAYLLASLTSQYWLLLVFMAIATAGAMAWHPVAMGELVKRMPERKAYALAIHGIGGTLAQVLAPLSVGFLLTLLSWQRVLQVSTLPAILVGILFVRLATMVGPPTQRTLTRSDLTSLLRALARASSVKALSVLIVSGMSVMALTSMTPLYLQETRGLSSGFAGVGFAAMVLSGALAATLVGRFSDRKDRKMVSLVGLVAGGGAVAVFGFVSREWALVLAMIAIGLALMGTRPVLMATALEAVGTRETSVLGFIFALGEGVGAIGAYLAGLVGEISLTWSLVFAAALAVLSAGLVAIQLGSAKQRSD
jgi:MFS family permease